MTRSLDNANVLNDINTYVQAGDYFTYGGTADVITLTSSNATAVTALTTGMRVRFLATLANTGATTINVDGTGAVSCVTVTGVALPADYIRTDIETEAYYDGTNFVVSRKVESGSNANGDWTKWEDGSASFCASKSETVNITTSSGIGGFNGTGTNWETPIAFSQAPKITYGTSSVPMSVGSITVTATSYQTIYRNISSTASANVAFDAIGKGKWY